METPAETEDARSRVSVVTSSGRRTVLLTSDGVSIEAEHLPPAGGSGHLAIVIAHGFSGSLERPAVRRAARGLRRYGGVIVFSFRGHGRSGGRSTVGDREILDVDAAVRWARRLGYARVAAVGFSMGGSVVLRHAGAAGAAASTTAGAGSRTAAGPTTGGAPADRTAPVRTGDEGDPVRPGARADSREPGAVDAVVAVSSPARWYYRGTAPMRRVHWAVTRPTGRLVSRWGLRTRIHPYDWDPVPLSPVQSVPFIPPTPLLIVHGDRDAYFPLDHPLSLAEAAGDGGADLWIEPGFGHAENAVEPVLLDRIGAWLTARIPAM